MVTTEIAQLTAESGTWRAQMRQYREEFKQLTEKLRQMALKATRQDELQDVEHYENQFYIQLINIHDLRHSIKIHDYKTMVAKAAYNGRINHTTLAEHQHLFTEYQRLQCLLEELKTGFQQFIAKFS